MILSNDTEGNQYNHYITIIMMGKSGGKSGYEIKGQTPAEEVQIPARRGIVCT